MATRRIQEFLAGNHVKYTLVHHSPAFTASEVAESIHIPGRMVAKSVVVSIAGRLALAVVPSDQEVDLTHLQSVTGAMDVRLAKEPEFADRFEGCKLGSEPPFGNLFGMETFVDRALTNCDFIAFNAGTHRDVIVMRFEDYHRLVHPRLVRITMEPIREKFHSARI